MAQAKLWSKDNKTFTLFGEAFQMPEPKGKRPQVLLFDIGGVCVSQKRNNVVTVKTKLEG